MRSPAALCCLLASLPPALADGSVSANRASMRGTAKRKFWPLDGVGYGFDETSDEMPRQATVEDTNQFVVPGEGVMTDEMAPAARAARPGNMVAPQHNMNLLSEQSRPYGRPYILKGPAASGHPVPEEDFRNQVPETGEGRPYEGRHRYGGMPTASYHAKPVKEYDESQQEAVDIVEPPRQKVDEGLTLEDVNRQKQRDVSPVVYNTPTPRIRNHADHPPPRRYLAANQQQQTVDEQQQVEVDDAAATEVDQAQAPAGRMHQQCMSFANYMKAQGSSGTEFVRMWSGTCMPAVQSGSASPQYASMCTALTGATSNFATKQNWDANLCCEAVVRVFMEAGIGASPLAP